ncbi:S8 family serine peptidase [uncultured Pseudoxanthomonas sp.]|uniref:S8 family serine peptidase n=1 Tax=uncultured Pseudoxanthomonas sp. TaxID=281701 RepID=UPI002594B092|nr:S8 family serine peptidase [uncultured Pseudoxanthomonas sp.]
MPREFRPVLNPVLSLKRDPQPTSVTGRGITESNVRSERLAAQRSLLASRLAALRESPPANHAGKILVAVHMFDDSLAPTHKPDALFRETLHTPLVAPLSDGYLAEVPLHALSNLEDIVAQGTHVTVRATVSRIRDIQARTIEDVLGRRSPERIWESAIKADGGNVFTAWLAPYADGSSRESVAKHLLELKEQGVILPLNNLVSITREPGSDADQLQIQAGQASQSIARAAREYRQNCYTKLQFIARDTSALIQLVASGAVFRIDPVRPVVAAEVPTAPDPDRPVPDEQWQPIVGIIDGGLFARSYEPMVAWRAPSLVADVEANRTHGNRVASLAVHGNAWNPHLDLPDLTCRIGIAQAIAKESHGASTKPDFISYLRSVIARHHGDTKVWNLSFNEPVLGDDPLEMSELGHELRKIAREYGVLPIVSIGNVEIDNNKRLCPPADCEAALSVGGRLADGRSPGEACPICLPGPGPDGLTKPELAWFSTLRGLGGSVHTGSSYAAAITSAVAAHTFHYLKTPTPDLVRALLINTSDRDAHDPRIGWGSPCKGSAMPWACPDGSVTLIWTADLRAGYWYYWDDIPIPPELVHGGKLKGHVALTAILNPVVSELGSANYFSTRLQVALQYTKPDGKIGNLAGSMKEDHTPEQEARAEWAKWNPIRHHAASIPNGRAFRGNTLRVCARVFGRDLYQHGIADNAQITPSTVAFALTLSAPASSEGGSGIYNSVARQLGAYVESAVNDIEVNVEQ